MTGTVIIVGFLVPIVEGADRFLPPQSVLYVEEPDVAEQRGAAEKLAGFPCIREVLDWEYQLPGAADRFYHRYRDEPVVAVIPATEYSVPFAARLAERYGLPGATLGAAQILRDKSLLRIVTSAAGIANPVSKQVTNADEVREFARRYPGTMIIKPSNRQGTVGTLIVNDPSEIDRAWAAAVAQDESVYVPKRGLPLRMLAEQFIAGTEYSVEMLVQDGVRRFANVTDKVLFPGVRPIEMGHVVPADIPVALSDALIAATEQVADAVGFRSGFLHCEWIVTAEGTPYLVECAGRLPGDWIVALIEYAWPIDIINRYFKVMRGEHPGGVPAEAATVCAVWFLPSTSGVVERVEGLEEASAVPDVIAVECLVALGDRTHELRSSWDRAAAAIAWAPSAEEAREAAATAISKIRIKVRPPN